MGIQNLLVAFAVGCMACGGVIDPAPDALSSDDAAFTDAPLADEPHVEHFVCELSTASSFYLVDCTTLPDGGPSYTDFPGDVDCRTYFEGAGQGCVPPMGCHGWIDGALLPGACVDHP
jgi:hypothetical protein